VAFSVGGDGDGNPLELILDSERPNPPPDREPRACRGFLSFAPAGTAAGLPIFLRLHLLLLLERGLTFSNVLITIRQPQPDFRHVGKGNPRFPFSKRARHI
jgi:hypothetical protein